MGDTVQHRRFSPSQADRFFLCPGSTSLLDRMPTRPDSVYADEGTNAHELLSVCLSEGISDPTVAWSKCTFFAQAIDRDMCYFVGVCLDYVYDIIGDNNFELWTDVFIQVPVSTFPGEADGHGDVILYIHDTHTLYVIDFKYGAGEFVDARNSRQLKQYSAGAAFNGEFIYQIDRVMGVILQPRIYLEHGQEQEHELTKDELYAYLDELERAMINSAAPEARLVPGEKQCKFCAAYPVCPAIEQGVSYLTDISPTEMLPILPLPDPTTVPLGKLAAVCAAKPFVSKWLNECKEYAFELSRTGYHVPGWKTVAEKPKRQWLGDEEFTKAELSKISGLPPEQFVTPKLMSITDAERTIKQEARSKVTSRKAKNAASREMTQAMAYLTDKPGSGGIAFVPDSDPRPPVNPASTFGHVVLPPPKGD